MQPHEAFLFTFPTNTTGLDGLGLRALTGPDPLRKSCKMGSGDLPGVKGPGRGADHPLLPISEVVNGFELYFPHPSVPP